MSESSTAPTAASSADKPESTAETAIPKEVLDDLCCRFIINLPEDERTDFNRILFQIEYAHWYYLDFRQGSMSCGFKEFSKQIFNHLDSLRPHLLRLDEIIRSWKTYKLHVPTFGAILLNETLHEVVLVQGFHSGSWGFPKGKKNKDEKSYECAIREVIEETGFDISSLIDPNEFLELVINGNYVKLYIIPGVNKSTVFKPLTRSEIKSIEWFNLFELPIGKCKMPTPKKGFNPNSFYFVTPFIRKLRKWVMTKQKELGISFQGIKKSEDEIEVREGQDPVEAKVAPVRVLYNNSPQSTVDLSLSGIEPLEGTPTPQAVRVYQGSSYYSPTPLTPIVPLPRHISFSESEGDAGGGDAIKTPKSTCAAKKVKSRGGRRRSKTMEGCSVTKPETLTLVHTKLDSVNESSQKHCSVISTASSVLDDLTRDNVYRFPLSVEPWVLQPPKNQPPIEPNFAPFTGYTNDKLASMSLTEKVKALYTYHEQLYADFRINVDEINHHLREECSIINKKYVSEYVTSKQAQLHF